jgi:prepilin-type N-terminal cleavage/methylation domain-containing protein
MRKAFTLIELVVSIIILSILMVFLYQSYADLNRVNKSYTAVVEKLSKEGLLKKTLYRDFLLASKNGMIVRHIDKKYDFVSFTTKNSIHRRINPYVVYIVKEKVLYRLESLHQIRSPGISREVTFDIDKLGSVEKFKLFGTRDNKKELFLLDLAFKGDEKILFKIKVLN